nr:MAG TPA: repressor protein CI [Caudoviricetes sp.]
MDVDNMSDYKLKIIELIESDVTGYQIYKDTGISQYVLSQLRQGKRDVDNLRLGTAEKLYEYACKVL